MAETGTLACFVGKEKRDGNRTYSHIENITQHFCCLYLVLQPGKK